MGRIFLIGYIQKNKSDAKFDAWAKLKGTPPQKAMEDYIKRVEKLQG
jgi:acyl-CoA-binding protein